MTKRAEDKTSEMQPETVDSLGLIRLKKLAKKVRKETGCKLSEALEQVAKAHGFKSWNNVHRFASKRPNSSQILIEFEEIWRRNMFVEIKANNTTLFSQGGGNSYYELEHELRINLYRVAAVSFEPGYCDPISSRNTRNFWPDEKPGYEKCQRIVFSDLIEECLLEVHSIIFLDTGDYHRVKRSIDELTAGKANK